MDTLRLVRTTGRALLLAGCLAVASSAGAAGAAAAASARPAFLHELEAAALDDPRAALALAEGRLKQATDPDTRFWALIGLIDVQDKLELDAAEAATVQLAVQALAALPAATPVHRLWLDVGRFQATWRQQPLDAMKALLQRIRQDSDAQADAELACAIHDVASGMLLAVESYDEVWLALESLERCGRAIGSVDRLVSALRRFGIVVGRGRGAAQVEPDTYFQRALDAVGTQPARWLRSLVVWDRGNAAHKQQRWDAALGHFEQARAMSQSIGDSAGVAAAALSIADLHLQHRDAARALPLLQEAEAILRQQDDTFRLAPLAASTLKAMALLKRPQVIDAIARARQWDVPSQPAVVRSRLARAMADGYASQGRYAEAFAEVVRSEALAEDARRVAADVQTLRLQARYETARRDAETAELRHRHEAAQLALTAQTARQRALWSVLVLMGLVLAGGVAWAWRIWTQRRALADLALRDELTGQPNRRAVTAYAQAQFDLARRLGVPLTVALIDLDHFKRVNDTLGHATGDEVLRTLACAAREVLRGHDQLGRWGGEEWLLVAPGLLPADLPALFERLRARFAALPVKGVDGAHGVTFSMGAATLDARTPSLDALVAQADAALYQAKANGRDRLHCAT